MSDSEGDSTPEFDTSINPYTVLSVPPTSTAAEIRSAYRRLALQTHPDKVPPSERDAAHIKFQELAFAYAILSDDSRRAHYDATGSTNENLFSESFDWKNFFRSQVKDLVSPEAVEKFKREYQGSDEERAAVLKAYTDSKGSLNVVFERVMVSSALDDEDRFRTMIQEAIDAGEVEAYKAFTNETAKSKRARQAKAEGEKKEAEEYAKELGLWDVLFGEKKRKEKEAPQAGVDMEADEEGGEEEEKKEEEEEEEEEEKEEPAVKGKGKGRTTKNTKPKAKPAAKGKKAKEDDTSALEALIKGRQANRQAGFLANMEAKYGANGSEVKKEKAGRKRGRGKRTVWEDMDEDEVEPTEEEFQAARKRVENGTSKRTGEKGKVENGGWRRSKRANRS